MWVYLWACWGVQGEEWGIRPEWGGVIKKEQVGDTVSHKSSSAVIRVHFDKFLVSPLSRTAAVALGVQTIPVALADL